MKSRDTGAWFRQPVLWLGAAVFLASIAVFIVTIVLAVRHADPPVETAGGTAFKVPLRNANDKP
jgi:hypothetical protein